MEFLFFKHNQLMFSNYIARHFHHWRSYKFVIFYSHSFALTYGFLR